MVITDDSDEARVRAAYQANLAAYLRMKDEIDANYPKGRQVAIDGGRVVADAESYPALNARLNEIGRSDRHALVVTAGEDEPEPLDIL
ncbi:MAG: hypothetical protein K2X87_30600 [Gemmataceae bacterium]|nr:hypothetical protein [Gemmataceae bacterium]